MAEKTLHTFAVWITIAPGSATINAQNIIASITGQGLGAQDRWNGRIDASDDYIPLVLSSLQHLPFEEAVEWSGLGCVYPSIPTRAEHYGAEGVAAYNLAGLFGASFAPFGYANLYQATRREAVISAFTPKFVSATA